MFVALLTWAALAAAPTAPSPLNVGDTTLARRHAQLAAFRRPTSKPVVDPQRAKLGWQLFFDARLSRDQTHSCGTCHNPSFQWGDGMATGRGLEGRALGRRSPTILNLAYDELFFWDGRAPSLEAQALEPVKSPAEMALPLDSALARLQRIDGYTRQFAAIWGSPAITEDRIAESIAAYERTLISGIAPFDRWVSGDEAAVSSAAKRGFDLFVGKARCSQCHAGWRFTDGGFYDIGINDQDLGRGAHVPGVQILEHAFKAPTLRNVIERAPYLHNGSAKTIEDVLALYNRGGDVRRPSLSPEIHALNLNAEELTQLRSFLETLSSTDAPVVFPVLP